MILWALCDALHTVNITYIIIYIYNMTHKDWHTKYWFTLFFCHFQVLQSRYSFFGQETDYLHPHLHLFFKNVFFRECLFLDTEEIPPGTTFRSAIIRRKSFTKLFLWNYPLLLSFLLLYCGACFIPSL